MYVFVCGYVCVICVFVCDCVCVESRLDAEGGKPSSDRKGQYRKEIIKVRYEGIHGRGRLEHIHT